MIAAFEQPQDDAAARSFVGKDIPYFEPAGTRPGARLRHGHWARYGSSAARLTDAGRTLTLATDPHPRLASYALPVPGRPRARTTRSQATT